MADTSGFLGWNFNESSEGQDSLTAMYRVVYDSKPTTPYTALARARAASGTPVPPYRHQFVTSTAWMFALDFSASQSADDDSQTKIDWTVTYGPPPKGESASVYQYANPLDRPPVFNVQYMDREEVIDKARNVEALSHGNGAGGNRAADTLGPIVNAAGKRPDEPLVDTTRLEVLVIQKNYPSLAAIVSRNRAFKKSTNSDSVQGYGVRELGYLLTESLGVQYENGVEFWPGVTTILADETTDLILDNVGYEYWDTGDNDWKRVVDADGNFMAEPINLKLDGDQGGTNATTITYRYKTEKAYASLFV